MSIKLDLHVHSRFQGTTFITPEQLKDALEERQMDGVAITNFFDISHALWLRERLEDYIIIIGQEIWTGDGHIIGLGLKEKISDFQSAEKTIDIIHQQGGIAIAPHPYLFLGVGKKISALPIDAIESYNALMGVSLIPNYLAMLSARNLKIPQIASTDTTNAAFIGRSHTEIMVDNPALILDAIRSGKLRLHRRALPLPLIFLIKNILNFKNIEPCSLHAFPCFICGKSMAVRLFKKEWVCLDCGMIQESHIACSNGHYLCRRCSIEREGECNKEYLQESSYQERKR